MDLSFLENPLFLAGLSTLGGDPRNFGQNFLGGMQAGSQLASQKQASALRAMQLKRLESQAAFNPQQYMAGAPTYEPMPPDMAGPPASMLSGVPQELTGQRTSFDAPGFLAGGMQAGFDPSDLASMARVLNPTAENKMMNISPGGAVWDPVSQTVKFQNQPRPAEAPSAIRELDILTDRLTKNPNDAAARDLLGKLTGADAKTAAADRAAALAEQRAQTAEIKKQGQAGVQERAQANRLNKFAGDLARAGIPETEQVLTNIESRLEKYKTGDIPGFNPKDNTAAKMGLTWAMSKEAQELRQAVQPLANLVIKERSGAAVTTPEWERFQTELGSGALMTSDRIRQGLKMFRELQEAAKTNSAAGVDDETLNTYMSNNPNLKFKRPKGAGKTTGGVSKEDAMAELRRRGLVK